jgi:hypothetical protein
MAGRRIRWAAAGKLAAIAAAVLAGLAALPALLGGDEPPPLPEDVGLGQVAPPAPAATATTPETAAPTGAAPLPVKSPAANRPPRAPAKAKSPRERDGSRRPRRERSQERPRADEPPPVAVPTYTPSYSPPPVRGEFQIEG